jgi:N,N'-diacetyllegionaminate synthase
MTNSFDLAGVSVGVGSRAMIIAEVGINHNGDPALAHKLVDAAADACADVVKFQTFVPELLAGAGAGRAEYQKRNLGEDGNQLEMLRNLTLSHETLAALKSHAEAQGLVFLATPFDLPSLEFLQTLGVPGFKVSSGDLTNLPFLRKIARYGRPILLSSGMSTLTEVDFAVEAIRGSGNPPLAIFHCVSDYPAQPIDCNLKAMATLRARFGVPTGWSDHTMGLVLAVAATALGAEVIEKHLTLNRAMPGPDHAASLEPWEFTALVRAVRDTEAALGDGIKQPRANEAATARLARKSVVALVDLPIGHKLHIEDFAVMRPGYGLPPDAAGTLAGRRMVRAVQAGFPIEAGDVENVSW